MKPLKILISGGGIAGFTLAYWLCEGGHQSIVIEKANTVRTEGYMIDFTGSGWDVIEKMNLVQELRAKEGDVPWLIFETSQGETITQVSYEAMAQSFNNRYVGLLRADLQEILYEAVKDRVEVRYNTTITAIEQTAQQVMVTYNNEQTESFDLVVGADGFRSNVRQLVFGPDEQFEHYLGYYMASFPYETTNPLKKGFVNYWEPQIMAAAYPLAPGQIQAFIAYTHKNMGHIPREAQKAAMQNRLAAAGWRIPEMLSGITEGTPLFFDSVTQITMPTWTQDRVVLVGDAAYCLTLISGQGASMAMAGAYILAEELGKRDDVAAALRSYEARLRPHIESKQEKARNFAKSFIPRSRFRIWFNYLAMKVLFLRPFRRFVGKQFGVESIFE